MNQEYIVNALRDKFAETNSTGQVILLSGKWGSGKSHAWSAFNEKIHNTHAKTLTLSLFGHGDLSSIRDRLKSDYLMTLSGVEKSTLTRSISRIVGNSGVRSVARQYMSQASQKWLGINVDLLSFVPMDFGADYIICFDDLERISPSIEMRDILGFIEEVSQNSNVVVIADESQLSDTDFTRFKEKVIDRTFLLDEQTNDSMVQVFENVFPSFKHLNMVIDMFNAYGKQNLRTLQKLADFLKSVSKQVDMDDDLARLCCAIIFEAVSVNGSLDCGMFSKGAILSDDKDIYDRYFISNRMRIISRHICEFYVSNRLNVDFVINELHPKTVTRCDELLLLFQEAFYHCEPAIFDAIKEFRDKIMSTNVDFFRNIESVIIMFFHARYLNVFFSLGFDDTQLESWTLKTIERMIDEAEHDALNSVTILDIYFMQAPDIAKTLVAEVEARITQKVNVRAEEQFRQFFELKEYSHCLRILENHPQLIPQILYVFEELATSNCTRQYVFFIRQLRDAARSQYSQHIRDKLTRLLDDIIDSVVQNRISTILRET